MTNKQLYETMNLHADPMEARRVALQFLNETATDSEGFRHIVDVETGRWQTDFEANGNTYKILSPSDGMSLRRYTKLRSALAVVGSDATFGEQMQNINQAKTLVDQIVTQKTGVVQLSVILENMGQAIARSDRKWHFSAWAATLFIIRKGEDVSQYDETLAEEKINDWNAANINASDFFFCCWLWEKRWNERLQEFAVRLT